MPWKPLPSIAFAICTYPYVPSSPVDLPLQIGDELYIIEQGGEDGSWYRGYLVAPPSLLAGLTSGRGQALEARVFSGVFPKECVEIREILGDVKDAGVQLENGPNGTAPGRGSLDASGEGPDSPTAVARRQARSAGFTDMQHPSAARSDTAPKRQRPPAPVPMLKIGDESVLGRNEPLVDEIASCLREWHSTNLHALLLNREYKTLDRLSDLVRRLDMTRRQLLHKMLTQQETRKLRENAVWDLVRGNKLLHKDIIVRSPQKLGRMLTVDDSAIELSELQTTMSLLEDKPLVPAESRSLHHVLVELKNSSLGVTKPTSYMLSLYSKTSGQKAVLISETFATDAFDRHGDGPAFFDAKSRCLFTDLTSLDIGDTPTSGTTVYLVIKAVVTDSPSSSTPSVRLQASSSPNNDEYSQSMKLNDTWRNANAVLKNTRRSLMFNSSRSATPSRGSRSSTPAPSQAMESKLSIDTPSDSDTAKSADSQGSDGRPVRKMVALGVLDIGSMLRTNHGTEKNCALRFPVISPANDMDPDAVYDGIVAEIYQDMRGTSFKYDTMTNLRVYIHPFIHPDYREVIAQTPTLLQSIQNVPRIGFPGAPTRPRSDIFLTLSKPYLPKGVLLAHPKLGSSPLEPSTGVANLQLTLEVRSASGERIENSIFPAANSAGHTAWRTPAVGRGESWNQTLRLAIRPEQVPGSHIVMSVADAFEFPFALAWVPLWTDDAFIHDGPHSLALYKYDEYTSNIMSGQGAYLQLPWSAKAKDETVTGPEAALHIETTLCSTKYSSNPTLLSLLKWREQRSGDIANVLKNFSFVPEIEIVKLLDETLDSLFEVLVENSDNEEIEDLVFYNLVIVLNITHDRRFNLQPLVDDYARRKFRQPFAFTGLVRSFTKLLGEPKAHDNARTLRSASKVGGHIFRLLVTARRQQITKEVGIGLTGQESMIVKDLMPIFKALEVLMRDPSPILIGTKTLIVQNYHTWLPPVATAISAEEVLALANNFVEACAGVKGRLIVYKLVLLQNLTSLKLFNSYNTRRTWRNKMYSWLSPHWGYTDRPTPQWRDQIRLCCSIVAELASEPNADLSIWLPKLLKSYQTARRIGRPEQEGFSMLYQSSYPFAVKHTTSKDKFDEVLIELGALLAVCSQSTTSMFPDLPFDMLKATLDECLDVYGSLLRCDAFPATWLSMHVYTHKACLRGLEHMFLVLESRFLPEPEQAVIFNTELWRSFLLTLMDLVGSEALALEGFSEQKRRAVWKVGGDVRELGADLLEKTWDALGWGSSSEEERRFGLSRLGGYQVQYVPGLVGPILQLCLSVHESLRGSAIAIVHSMIISEGTLSENLGIIKAEMIDSLEQYFKTRALNDGMVQKMFVDELAQLFRGKGMMKDDPLWPQIRDLLQSLDHLLDLLIAAHSSETNNEASHIVDVLRLLEFFKDMRKESMYINYLHKLANLQAKRNNPTEAALALKLHADMYDWDTVRVLDAVTDPPMPKQTPAERREQLLFQMIAYFEEGGAWHKALETYRELGNHYERGVYDFNKLARTQRAMATIHDRIGKGELQTPRYFRVIFLGLGFSPNLRDKQFIYEASSSDKLGSFTDRILSQYPSAQIITGGDMGDMEGQYLMINGVSAQKNLEHPIARRTRVSQALKNHFMFANPTKFTTTSRRHATKGEVNEQIMEKVVYTIGEPLPTILRRSEIVRQDTVRIPPVQIGIERAMRKTQELLALEEEIVKGGDISLNKMSELLRLLVTDTSAGNVVGYWDLLPPSMKDEESSDSGADEDAYAALQTVEGGTPGKILLEVLRVTLIDHAAAIRQCLNLYTRAAHKVVGAELRSAFEESFSPILAIMEPVSIVQASVVRKENAHLVHHSRSSGQLKTEEVRAVYHRPAVSARSSIEGLNLQSADWSGGFTLDATESIRPSREVTDSQMSAFSRDELDDPAYDATPPSIGGKPKTVSKQSSTHNLPSKLGNVTGSMTKRLSGFNVGRRMGKGQFKGPSFDKVSEQ